MAEHEELEVPRWLARGAAFAWRLLILAAGLVVAGFAISRLLPIVLPLLAALFVTTILAPPANWLHRRGWPPLAATFVVFIAGMGIVVTLLLWLVPAVVGELAKLGDAIRNGFDEVERWLINGPLHLSQQQVDSLLHGARSTAARPGGLLAREAIAGVSRAAEAAGMVALTLVLAFFFVKDGAVLSEWLLGFVDPRRVPDLREICSRAWATLGAYVRGTAINGTVNGVLMGLGLVLLGVPLALPIAVLTFFGGFFPIVGAVVTGFIAALVALVDKGLATSLLVVGLAVIVHNVEGYLVGPVVLGRAVHLHTVVILTALAVGGILGGIVGAAVAVPTAAVLLSITDYYRHPDQEFASVEAAEAVRPSRLAVIRRAFGRRAKEEEPVAGKEPDAIAPGPQPPGEGERTGDRAAS